MNRRGGSVWIVLLIIIGVGIGLRLYRIGSQSFWVDELLTMEDLNGRGHADAYLPRNVLLAHPPSLTDPAQEAPWWKVWSGLEEESHPPLYFVLCRLWRDIAGSSETQIRFLSTGFSVMGIALLFFIMRDLSGSWPGLWSAGLMALSVPQIVYAQEARNYSTLTAVSLLAAFALVRIEKRGLTVMRWAVLVVLLLATALTHYFSFGVLVALAIYALLVLRGLVRWKIIGAFAIAAVLFVLFWGKNLLTQRKMLLHDFPMYANPAGHTEATLMRVVALPLRHLIGASMSTEASMLAGIVFLLTATLTIIYRRRDLLLWWLWLIGSIGTIAIIDLARTAEQLTMVKYTFEAGPAVCAIAAGCLPSRFRGWRYVVPALLVGLELYFLPGAYVDWKGDWRSAAETVVALTPPNDPVLIAGNGTGRPTLSWLYLGMNLYTNPWPRALAISDREPSPELMQQLRKYSRLTLVTDCVSAQPVDIVNGFAPISPPRYFPNVGVVWEMGKR